MQCSLNFSFQITSVLLSRAREYVWKEINMHEHPQSHGKAGRDLHSSSRGNARDERCDGEI